MTPGDRTADWTPPAGLVAARAAWSRLAEPGDTVAGALVGSMGPVDALTWLEDAVTAGARRVLPVSVQDGAAARTLGRAVERWAPRLDALEPERDLDVLHRHGGTLLVPEDPRWPEGLLDLGTTAPHALWVLGRPDLGAVVDGAVALIGARACTGYGERVAADLAAGVGAQGRCVVSGGAYGIDAVAHRAALTTSGGTVAVLAGGVDRFYPVGNARLLRAVVDGSGAVVSEVPPGGVPSRSRFLQRNRVIAALAGATVVVEAAWRSGALSTAGHAARLLRPVGAVPGPVTSAASAGCHRLLRDGAAICVTDVDEVMELVRGPDADAGARSDGLLAEDGLGPAERRALDALPLRRPAGEESLVRVAGLAPGELRAALGVLELAGLAVREQGGWRRGGGA
jgi:DNA processing protein